MREKEKENFQERFNFLFFNIFIQLEKSYAMPMMFARDGDRILLHCSVATGFASKITK